MKSRGILGIEKHREPVQWVDGKYVTIWRRTKESPEINPGNSKLLDDSRTSENKGSASNV